MNELIFRLSQIIDALPPELEALSETALASRPSPNKWSSKEILGHLCDSAIHNLTRFIHAQMEEAPFSIQKYDQNQWVRLQHYQLAPITDIIPFWIYLNKSILRIISAIPQEKCTTVCILPNGDTVTLQWLVSDYLTQMEHHLQQMAENLKLGGKS
ncbi:DinB family protein [Brevibacillus invocatus]|uniref:DinB family protein n=1 Tax=Brevibacillus invocatus TaxID=173959 RepID=A0A3M8BX77_9BACL|nr:DinB family protein [Brevibacillus invocatus]RNB68041.1 DinB family protein [Brevibacillus invocatus]